MQVITDAPTLMRQLGAYSFAPTTDPELADHLQAMPGNDVDKMFLAMELLHAFRDRAGADGVLLLAQLVAFSLLQNWSIPGKPGRLEKLGKGAKRELGEPDIDQTIEEDPKPIVSYREDGKDWREEVDPDAPPRVAPVPKEVTPRQFRLALIQVDLDEAVEAIVASQDKSVRVAWDFATAIYRNDPLIIGSAAAMELTTEQVDDVFRLAATL